MGVPSLTLHVFVAGMAVPDMWIKMLKEQRDEEWKRREEDQAKVQGGRGGLSFSSPPRSNVGVGNATDVGAATGVLEWVRDLQTGIVPRDLNVRDVTGHCAWLSIASGTAR